MARKQTMIESIMSKSLAKIILATVCAVPLAIVTIFFTEIPWWGVLVMLALVLASFANTYFELKKAFANGDIVAVYGNCISVENATNFVGKTQKNILSYRFISLAQNEDAQDENVRDENVASFYIKGEKGKFVEGESYCFLFKKNGDTDTFNEGNLIGYETIKTSPVTISTTETDVASTTEIDEENEYVFEEDADQGEEETSPKIIYFSPKKEDRK